MVIWCWRQRCAQLGVRFLYKCGGKLVGERTRTPSTSWMTELSFVDDAAVVASTREDLVKATVELNSVVTAFGLTISIPKTKFWLWGVMWCRVTWTPLLLVVILLRLWHLFVIWALLWNPMGIER